MSIDLKQAHSYVDLGSTWLRDHTARIQQRHLQFGRHCKLDLGSLLARAASLSRIEICKNSRVTTSCVARRSMPLSIAFGSKL